MSTRNAKRIAFADLLFSWPPHGGADVDLYETVRGLQRLGYEVHLFFAGYEHSWERGSAEPSELPFPATRLEFTWRTLTPRAMPRRFAEAIAAWAPDLVVCSHGFFLKPFLSAALSRFRTVGRYYAYELACPRDLRLFRNGAPCPNNYLRTPDTCRACALEFLGPQIKRWRILAWAHEYLAARACLPGYHRILVESLWDFDAVIVSNIIMAGHFAQHNPNVLIFPGGVDLADYGPACDPPARPDGKKTILMSGRVEDPLKGLHVLLEAGERLAAERDDFEIWATHTDRRLESDWFKPIGWHDHEKVKAFQQQADICVVPSVWEEPFGLAALEAMAAGRPVCASRSGGLQHIVRHRGTGFLFDRGASAQLAQQLACLLDDAPLRRDMGWAGRAVAEAEYDWPRVIQHHWPPLIERITP